MVKETSDDEVSFEIVFDDDKINVDSNIREVSWWKKLPIINMFVRYEHDLKPIAEGGEDACRKGEEICS